MESGLRTLELRTGISVPCFIRGPETEVPLLLLHAWAESRRTFDRLIPLLPGLRILAPDLRGQGEADKPDGGYSLSDQAEDVAAILDALDVPRAYVLGSSSGGYAAQQFAAMYPERVAGLVLVGAPLSLQGRPSFADEVDALTDPLEEQWVRDSLLWFPLLHPVPAWYVEDRIKDGLAMPARAWKGILDGLVEAVPPTEAGSISAPTLVIWGASDELLPRSDQEILVSRIPGSRLVVYSETGHLVLWECPEQVAADTMAFLEAL